MKPSHAVFLFYGRLKTIIAIRTLLAVALNNSALLHPIHFLKFLSQEHLRMSTLRFPWLVFISCNNVYFCPVTTCFKYSSFLFLVITRTSGTFPKLPIISLLDIDSYNDFWFLSRPSYNLFIWHSFCLRYFWDFPITWKLKTDQFI